MLAGHFEPDRLEVEFGSRALQSIRELIVAIVSALAISREYPGISPAIV